MVNFFTLSFMYIKLNSDLIKNGRSTHIFTLRKSPTFLNRHYFTTMQ